MKTIKTAVIVLITVISLAGCKKDKVVPLTTAQKLQFKWSVSTVVSTENVSPSPSVTDTYVGTASDYFDFKSDGKVYVKQEGEPEDVVTYTIVNDTQITLDDVAFTIKKLDDHNLILYSKQVFKDGANYTEDTFNLKK